MNNLYLDSTVYENGEWRIGPCDLTQPSTTESVNYWDYWYPIIERWYPVVYPTYDILVEKKSKIEQAFKLVQKLIKKKIIKTLTLKQFIELVNEIADEVI
ncbi:MAG: hypothetical protein ACTSQG_06320 [Promethearchaeota archaeon]